MVSQCDVNKEVNFFKDIKRIYQIIIAVVSSYENIASMKEQSSAGVLQRMCS